MEFEAGTGITPLWINIGVTVLGAFIVILLGIIALFLKRLLTQFDLLTAKVASLDTTFTKIESDITGDLRVLTVTYETLKRQLDSFEKVWDRLRDTENKLLVLENSCPVKPATGNCSSNTQ